MAVSLHQTYTARRMSGTKGGFGECGVKGAWEGEGGWCSLGDGILGKTELPLKGLACLLFFASLGILFKIHQLGNSEGWQV